MKKKLADRPYMYAVPDNGFRWVEEPFEVMKLGGQAGRLIVRFGQHPSGPTKDLPKREPRETIPDPALVAEPGETRTVELPRDLFLQFSNIKPESKDQIAAFASNYGALGVPRFLTLDAPLETSVPCALLSDWTDQIRTLKRAVELYTLIKEENSGALAKIVHLAEEDERQRVEYTKAHSSETIPLPPGSRPLGKHEIILRARIVLQRWINLQLKELVDYRVMWTGQFQKMIETITPVGLAGAMWMQLARAVCDECSFTNCASCGEAMVVAPEGDRLQKKFCSPKCRMRVYEQRKAEARNLYAGGMSVAQIAAKLGAKVKDVQGWILKVKAAVPAQTKRSVHQK